ncbi:peptidase S8/S53 domain-containing protein [Tanacetum coccineum]
MGDEEVYAKELLGIAIYYQYKCELETILGELGHGDSGVICGLLDDGVQQSFTMIFRIESNYPKYYNVLEFRKNGEAIIETRYANNDDIDPIFQVYDLCSGCVTDIGLPWSGRNDFEYSNVSRLSMKVTVFSSRGPNIASPGIMKPDIVGPGVDILAAWHKSVDNNTGTQATFNIISGMSMSCPHLAGIAALLKSTHSNWSPAAIKSAIINDHSKQLSIANDPGLILDIQPDDYILYLCGLGYTPKILTNVGSENSTYTIEDISVPQGVDIEVLSHSQQLSFTALHQKLQLRVIFARGCKDRVNVPYSYNFIVLQSGKYSVRLLYVIMYK